MEIGLNNMSMNPPTNHRPPTNISKESWTDAQFLSNLTLGEIIELARSGARAETVYSDTNRVDEESKDETVSVQTVSGGADEIDLLTSQEVENGCCAGLMHAVYDDTKLETAAHGRRKTTWGIWNGSCEIQDTGDSMNGMEEKFVTSEMLGNEAISISDGNLIVRYRPDDPTNFTNKFEEHIKGLDGECSECQKKRDTNTETRKRLTQEKIRLSAKAKEIWAREHGSKEVTISGHNLRSSISRSNKLLDDMAKQEEEEEQLQDDLENLERETDYCCRDHEYHNEYRPEGYTAWLLWLTPMKYPHSYRGCNWVGTLLWALTIPGLVALYGQNMMTTLARDCNGKGRTLVACQAFCCA